MNARNKRRIIAAALALLGAVSFVLYYHYFRRLSPVVNGPASLERIFSAHTADLQAVAFDPSTPQGDIIASGSTDGAVKIWRRADGSILRELQLILHARAHDRAAG